MQSPSPKKLMGWSSGYNLLILPVLSYAILIGSASGDMQIGLGFQVGVDSRDVDSRIKPLLIGIIRGF